MTNKLHKLFLFTLFALFSTSMAADENKTMQLETDPETGELYFDWSRRDAWSRWGKIPVRVDSFKVVGANWGEDWLLEAPDETYNLIVSGEFSVSSDELCNVYDGESSENGFFLYVGRGKGCLELKNDNECNENFFVCRGGVCSCGWPEDWSWGACEWGDDFGTFRTLGPTMLFDCNGNGMGTFTYNLKVKVVRAFYPYNLIINSPAGTVGKYDRGLPYSMTKYSGSDLWTVEFFVKSSDYHPRDVSVKMATGDTLEYYVLEGVVSAWWWKASSTHFGGDVDYQLGFDMPEVRRVGSLNCLDCVTQEDFDEWMKDKTVDVLPDPIDVVVNLNYAEFGTAANGFYVNMLKEGKRIVAVPGYVSSFMVYDNGGKDEDYSALSKDTLVITAPAGWTLQVSGSVNTESNNDKLIIYDGMYDNFVKTRTESGEKGNINVFNTSGQTLSLVFQSNATNNYRGFGLKVTVVKPNYGAIAIANNVATMNSGYDGNDTIRLHDDIKVSSVVLDREFNVNGYSTVTLPFDINGSSVTGAKQFLEFAGVAPNAAGVKEVQVRRVWCDGDVLYNEVVAAKLGQDSASKIKAICEALPGDLEAYKPYMVEMNATTLTFDGAVTLKKTATPAARVGNWIFKGTLAGKSWGDSDTEIGKAYGFAAGSEGDVNEGDFVKVASGASIGPLLAYLLYSPQQAPPAPSLRYEYVAWNAENTLPAQMNVVIVDEGDDGEEHTTSIGTLDTRRGEFIMQRNYDLKGRKVNGMPKARGVYYGKKVVK